jgi:hypothetical protein
MKTGISSSMKAVTLWAVAMLIPLLLWYLKSSEFKVSVFLLFPIVISMFSRIGWFWVRPELVAYSSIIAFLYGSVLRLNKKVDAALAEPDSDKATSAIALSSMVFVFLLSMFLMGTYYKALYNPENFGSSPY